MPSAPNNDNKGYVKMPIPNERPTTRPLPRLFAQLGMATGLTLATIGSAQAQSTVNAVMHSALRILDPVASSATITRNHGYMVFDTLLGVDAELVPQPQMADWEVSDDGLTYTFTLREGLEWHDGSPVTTADCLASLERWAQYDAGGQLLMTHVERLEALDERRFVLELSAAFNGVIDLLAKPSAVPPFMMPERVASIPAGETISEQIGSGPFRFVADEFQPGNRVVYERFDAYRPREEAPSGTADGKVVNVDRVEWIHMPDAQTTLNALTSGDIDFIERAPIDLLPLLETHDDVTTDVLDSLGMQVVGRMNFLHPPFDDVRFRRAALLAVGQGDVLSALIGDPRYFDMCGAVLGCGTALGSETGAESLLEGGHLDEARALLEEAGYDGTPVVILQPSDVATLVPQPIVVAQALRQAGFNVDIQQMDWQTLVSRRANQSAPTEGGWNLMFTNFSVDSIWNPIINPLLSATGSEGGWFGWPTDPELESLRGEFALADGDTARADLAERIQQHALDEVLLIPLGQFRNVTAWREELDGLLPGPVPVFWNLTKDE